MTNTTFQPHRRPHLMICPRCISEGHDLTHELRAGPPGMASCQRHGDMTLAELFKTLAEQSKKGPEAQ